MIESETAIPIRQDAQCVLPATAVKDENPITDAHALFPFLICLQLDTAEYTFSAIPADAIRPSTRRVDDSSSSICDSFTRDSRAC